MAAAPRIRPAFRLGSWPLAARRSLGIPLRGGHPWSTTSLRRLRSLRSLRGGGRRCRRRGRSAASAAPASPSSPASRSAGRRCPSVSGNARLRRRSRRLSNSGRLRGCRRGVGLWLAAAAPPAASMPAVPLSRRRILRRPALGRQFHAMALQQRRQGARVRHAGQLSEKLLVASRRDPEKLERAGAGVAQLPDGPAGNQPTGARDDGQGAAVDRQAALSFVKKHQLVALQQPAGRQRAARRQRHEAGGKRAAGDRGIDEDEHFRARRNGEPKRLTLAR